MTIAVGQIGSLSGTYNGTGTIQTTAVATSATGSGFTIKVLTLSTTGTITYAATDTFNNSYTHKTQQVFAAGGGTYSIDTFYCESGTGGTGHQATLTPTTSDGTSYRGTYLAALIEGTGAPFVSGFGQSTSLSYPYVANPPYASTTLTVAPPSAGIMAISSAIMSFASTSATPTESTGFTVQKYYDASTAIAFAIATKIISSSGAVTPSWSGTSAQEAFTSLDSWNDTLAPVTTAPASMQFMFP